MRPGLSHEDGKDPHEDGARVLKKSATRVGSAEALTREASNDEHRKEVGEAVENPDEQRAVAVSESQYGADQTLCV